jgi:hypothetical protein
VSILNMLLIDVMLLQSQVTLVHNTICSLSNLQPCTQYQIYFLTNFFIVTLGNSDSVGDNVVANNANLQVEQAAGENNDVVM